MMAGLKCGWLACAVCKVLVLGHVLQSRLRRIFQIIVHDAVDGYVDFDDVIDSFGGCSVTGQVGAVAESLDDLVVEVAIASVLRGAH